MLSTYAVAVLYTVVLEVFVACVVVYAVWFVNPVDLDVPITVSKLVTYVVVVL